MAHLPPLNALRAFEVSSRTGSFTLAAEELCVSQGAVSRHVAHLEDYLGVKLFTRHHRHIELTACGEEYAKQVQQIFANIRKATDATRSRSGRQTVNIALFPTVATQWLSPRLNRFHAAHPDIDLVVRTSVGWIDLEREEYDVVNRRGPISDPDLEYIPLFKIALNPVCNPSLLEGDKPLRDPADLKDHVLLHSLNRVDDWNMWFAHLRIEEIDVTKGLEFDNTALACQAAMGGAGVAMGIVHILEDDLARANLIQPFPFALETGETYGLALRHDSLGDPAIRAFRDWILSETAETNLEQRSARRTQKPETQPAAKSEIKAFSGAIA